MITKEQFKKFIREYQAFDKAMKRIEEAIGGKNHYIPLWECDWCESVGCMLDTFLESHFNEHGCDLICWWLFEDVDHIIWQTTVPDLFRVKSEIEYDVNDLEDLWNYMIKFKKDYFKNES